MSVHLSGGRAAIHYAGDMGQTDVIKILVAAGADVNVRTSESPQPAMTHASQCTRSRCTLAVVVVVVVVQYARFVLSSSGLYAPKLAFSDANFGMLP